jgi:cobalt-precorrin-5B (C1)-methyltransferase
LVVDTLSITLPKEKLATIEVMREDEYTFSTIKGDNDDMDVTKGAKISCALKTNPPKNLKRQTPSLLTIGRVKLYIWAGEGVGVVTKKGLKIEPNYPAINPTPLSMMRENSLDMLVGFEEELHVVFEVENGEEIAKATANAKVGVLGGISILGTRGIVKPISATAYIDSIEAELGVASEFDESVVVFTLGNSAFDYAQKHYHETTIVEIGNFVYDATARLQNYHFKKLVFITSVAKMTKVAQGCKNTHNRFGGIDFDEVKRWLVEEFDIHLEAEFVTLKGLLESLDEKYSREFTELMSKKSTLVFKEWLRELSVETREVEVITLSLMSLVKNRL